MANNNSKQFDTYRYVDAYRGVHLDLFTSSYEDDTDVGDELIGVT